MGNVVRLIDETQYAEVGPTTNAEYRYDTLSRISRADLDIRGHHAEPLLWSGVNGASADAWRFARWAGPAARSSLAAAANAMGRLGTGRYHSSNRRPAQRMRRRAR